MLLNVYNCEELRILRTMLGISAVEMADYVGVTKQTIYNVERGKCISNPLLIAMSATVDKICIDNGMNQNEILKAYKEANEQLYRYKLPQTI